MNYEQSMTDYLKLYDRLLYCKKVGEQHHVYRKSHRWESYDLDGTSLTVLKDSPHFIFAMTDNWKRNGKPASWSKMIVWDRLRMIDSQNRDVLESLLKDYEKADQEKDRLIKNQTDDAAREMAPQFKKAFSDTITANMNKQVSVERRADKMIKYN